MQQRRVLAVKILEGSDAQLKMLLRYEMRESSADDMVCYTGFNRLQSIIGSAPYHTYNNQLDCDRKNHYKDALHLTYLERVCIKLNFGLDSIF